ncbi:putative methyltransferase [Pirellula sp. SH-Sr6A]|uniref:DNA-methyltransferase n=1 Tax=Pirellula sp. SH-Sr6A TaxID=1632865 RepID=UPI00078C52E2|nr:DNA methyltransferase [Pirellula sp. SH-Sr6A]AMV33758.1 putative methyltransferase [Pirellula sp. SH-Sr6A]
MASSAAALLSKSTESWKPAKRPELPIKPYYSSGGITLYHADCRHVLPYLDNFDLLLTDPPYGIRADNCGGRKQAKKGKGTWRDYGDTDWDRERPPASCFNLMMERCKHQIIWGGNYFSDMLTPSMRWLVWDKGQRNFSLADCEFAWTNFWKASRIFTYHRAKANRDHRVHPTQKPLALIEWCIGFADGVRTVLDPFAGGGTTLVACKKLGIAATGIELNQVYCDSIVERLDETHRDPTVGIK